MKYLLSILIILIFAFSAFSQSAAEKERIVRSISSLMDQQAADWNDGDLDGFMRGYWRSDATLFISGDRVTRGWQATLDNYKKSYPTREKMGNLTFSDLEIEVISKDAAIVLGSWRLQRSGDQPKGKFTLFFRKKKEGWRIVRDHTS